MPTEKDPSIELREAKRNTALAFTAVEILFLTDLRPPINHVSRQEAFQPFTDPTGYIQSKEDIACARLVLEELQSTKEEIKRIIKHYPNSEIGKYMSYVI